MAGKGRVGWHKGRNGDKKHGRNIKKYGSFSGPSKKCGGTRKGNFLVNTRRFIHFGARDMLVPAFAITQPWTREARALNEGLGYHPNFTAQDVALMKKGL